MKVYGLPEDLMNAILGYLGEQPYVKVASLINAIGEQVKKGPITMQDPNATRLPEDGKGPN